jgi:hypothetical protein
MSSPVEEITITCPKCKKPFKTWRRASMNLKLDNFDEKYLREATLKICPDCGATISLESLIVGKDGVWQFGAAAATTPVERTETKETCGICGCTLNRGGEYATATIQGRSHATKHHYVAERFFGRSANRRGTQRKGLFLICPWGLESKSGVFCYECHEVVLHNPVFLPEDIAAFAELVRRRGFSETKKPDDQEKLAGRVRLLHEIIVAGLTILKVHPDKKLP